MSNDEFHDLSALSNIIRVIRMSEVGGGMQHSWEISEMGTPFHSEDPKEKINPELNKWGVLASRMVVQLADVGTIVGFSVNYAWVCIY
jgi:hypothetical protein